MSLAPLLLAAALAFGAVPSLAADAVTEVTLTIEASAFKRFPAR